MSEKKIKFINNEMYEYEIYPLVDQYDPILVKKPDPFYFEDSAEHSRTPVLPRVLAVSLLETMINNYGVGLAANQCGIPLRVFAIGAEGYGSVFFNPEIVETTGLTEFEEGCLSFPGLFLPIKRPETVTIKYQDMNGVPQQKTYTGLSARIVLHEYDHMEGIVFTSLLSPLLVNRAKTKIKKNLKLLKRQQIQDEKNKIIRKALGNLVTEQKKLEENQALTIDP